MFDYSSSYIGLQSIAKIPILYLFGLFLKFCKVNTYPLSTEYLPMVGKYILKTREILLTLKHCPIPHFSKRFRTLPKSTQVKFPASQVDTKVYDPRYQDRYCTLFDHIRGGYTCIF